MPRTYNRVPIEGRFAQSVVRGETDDSCWEWSGSRQGSGYATISAVSSETGKSSNRPAHRFAYEHFVGPIPAGMVVRRSCKSRVCCNPTHLYLQQMEHVGLENAGKVFRDYAREPLQVRYERYVTRSSDLDACWGWSGGFASYGYGQLAPPGGSRSGNGPLRAHRVSYELHCGPIPEGMHVLHRCDNPPCSNPRHLFLGTGPDNSADMAAKGRSTLGGRNPNAKITMEIARAIRADRETGLTYEEIGKRYDIRASNVWHIVQNRTWKEKSHAST